jgi:hypothetical protein
MLLLHHHLRSMSSAFVACCLQVQSVALPLLGSHPPVVLLSRTVAKTKNNKTCVTLQDKNVNLLTFFLSLSLQLNKWNI